MAALFCVSQVLPETYARNGHMVEKKRGFSTRSDQSVVIPSVRATSASGSFSVAPPWLRFADVMCWICVIFSISIYTNLSNVDYLRLDWNRFVQELNEFDKLRILAL